MQTWTVICCTGRPCVGFRICPLLGVGFVPCIRGPRYVLLSHIHSFNLTYIDLSSINLQGNISSSITMLDTLQVLILSSKQLKGEIPYSSIENNNDGDYDDGVIITHKMEHHHRPNNLVLGVPSALSVVYTT